MSIALKQGAAVVALEWGALGMLGQVPGGWHLAGFFLLHALASVLLAFLARTIFFRRPSRDFFWETVLVFVSSFFIPLFGALGLLLALLIYYHRERRAGFLEIGETTIPAYVQSRKGGHERFGPGGARSRLLNVHTPLEARLKALMLFQSMPTRLSGGVLRQVLTDPVDDVRLLAYGMLDTQEQTLNNRIHEEREKLAQADSDFARYNARRRLAGLYSELIYQGLVQGDLRDFAVEQAEMYTRLALQWMPEDPSLLVQQAKLLQQQGRFDEAADAYLKAQNLGMPHSRIIPWLAEMHFRRHDYAEARRLLAQMDAANAPGSLRNVLAYWEQKKV